MVSHRVTLNVDLEAAGRQVGTAAIEFSDDAHAYAAIPVPVVVLASGPGPTVLLAAGTHGDEWEGQLLLRRLIRSLDPARLHGRLIVLPAHTSWPCSPGGARRRSMGPT